MCHCLPTITTVAFIKAVNVVKLVVASYIIKLLISKLINQTNDSTGITFIYTLINAMSRFGLNVP